MKRPPRTVPICGLTYKVRHKRMKLDNGYPDHDKKLIWIASGLDVQTEWEIWWHEVTHVMEYHTEGNRTITETASRCRHQRKPRSESPHDAAVHDLIERIDTPLMVLVRDLFGAGK